MYSEERKGTFKVKVYQSKSRTKNGCIRSTSTILLLHLSFVFRHYGRLELSIEVSLALMNITWACKLVQVCVCVWREVEGGGAYVCVIDMTFA